MTTPIYGDTRGLNAREVEALKALGTGHVSQNLLISRELAFQMTHLSDSLHRKVGLILSRTGHVECVVLGTAERAYLPDIGRSRAGIGRLRGIRFVVTNLEAQTGQGSHQVLTMDEVTDLAKLRLDFVVGIVVL